MLRSLFHQLVLWGRYLCQHREPLMKKFILAMYQRYPGITSIHPPKNANPSFAFFAIIGSWRWHCEIADSVGHPHTEG